MCRMNEIALTQQYNDRVTRLAGKVERMKRALGNCQTACGVLLAKVPPGADPETWRVDVLHMVIAINHALEDVQ